MSRQDKETSGTGKDWLVGWSGRRALREKEENSMERELAISVPNYRLTKEISWLLRETPW